MITRKDLKHIDPIERILLVVVVTILALLGVACLVGFILSGMWHCFMIAGMCALLIWAWITEDYDVTKD